MKLIKNTAIPSSEDAEFEVLVNRIVSLVSDTKDHLLRHIDDTLVITNWHIGEYIVEFEKDGNARAKYGEGLMRKLSKRLTLQLGKGYSLSNLHNMRRLYLYYPKIQTVSGKYATYGMDSNIFVSKYQLYLPNREELRRMVQSILEAD